MVADFSSWGYFPPFLSNPFPIPYLHPQLIFPFCCHFSLFIWLELMLLVTMGFQRVVLSIFYCLYICPLLFFLIYFCLFSNYWLPFYLIKEIDGSSIKKRKYRRKTYFITISQYFEKSYFDHYPWYRMRQVKKNQGLKLI